MRWMLVFAAVAACGSDDSMITTRPPPDTTSDAATLPDAAPPVADALPASPDADPGTHGGTRIKRMVGTTPDGARDTYGWYDAQLGVPCLFAAASDGKIRCLPSEYAVVTSDWFTDAACTVTLAYETNGCTRKYGFSYGVGDDAAGGTCTYRRVELALAPHSGRVFHRSSTGECSDGTESWAPGVVFFSGTEIPASTFQELVVTLE